MKYWLSLLSINLALFIFLLGSISHALKPGDRVSVVSENKTYKGTVTKTLDGGKVEVVWDGNSGITVWESSLLTYIVEAKTIATFEFQDKDFALLRLAFSRPDAGSFAITGEAGSGKTELLKAFVKKVQEGAFPEISKDTKFIFIDRMTIAASISTVGQFEDRVLELLAQAKASNAIVVVDELRTLRGAGVHKGSNIDFFNMVKTSLADGTLRIAGTTTEEEYEDAFAGDESLLRRMPQIKRPTVTDVDEVVKMLQGWSKKFGLEPLPEGLLKYLVQISEEYDGVSTPVAKAVRLMGDVYADVAQGKKTVNALTREDVERAATRLYNLDEKEFDPEYRKSKLNIFERKFNGLVSGLDDVKKSLKRDTFQVLMGTHDRTKPRLRYILAGPKGLAKTHIARSYAKAMNLPFKRIAMPRFVSAEAVEDLRREIVTALRKNPRTVILFDEIEKVSLTIQYLLLDLMDSDHITSVEHLDGTGVGRKTFTKVRTTGATLFFATNAGQNFVLDNPEAALDDTKVAMEKDKLSEFLIDRSKRVIVLTPPKNKDEFRAVLKMKLDEAIETQTEIEGRKIQITDEKEFLDNLTHRYFKPRASYRAVIDELTDAFGYAVAVEKSKDGDTKLPLECTLLSF